MAAFPTNPYGAVKRPPLQPPAPIGTVGGPVPPRTPVQPTNWQNPDIIKTPIPGALGAAAPAAPAAPQAIVPPKPVSPVVETVAPKPPANPMQVTGPMQNAPDANYQVGNRVGDTSQKLSDYQSGPLSDVGNIYHDNIKQDLTSANNPYVASIRETADRRATGNTYQAQKQAEESLAQQGIMPGTAQYSRALSRAMATSHDANRDLLNQSAGVQRDFYQKAMDRGQGYEKDMVTRANDDRKLAFDTSKYGDERGDLQHSTDETTRLEGKSDNLAAINSIKDPKARQAAMNNYLAGGDVKSGILKMYDPSGELGEQYRSATPGQDNAKAIEDQVRSALTGQTNPKTGQPYTEQEIRDTMGRYQVANLDNQYKPALQGQEDAALDASRKLLATGGKLDQAQRDALVASGDIKTLSPQASFTGAEAANYVGKQVKIGDGYYTVSNADTVTTKWNSRGLLPDERSHTTYMQVKDDTGRVQYLYGGALHSSPPKADKNPH